MGSINELEDTNRFNDYVKEELMELSDADLNKVAGGFGFEKVGVTCPPGCDYIQNACVCNDDNY